MAEIKRGVETADQEPIRHHNEVITSEESVVSDKLEVETADHDPVENQRQTGDRLTSYSPEFESLRTIQSRTQFLRLGW